MKYSTFILLIVLSLVGMPAISQTYLYLESITISPQLPTENDIISITVSGNMSSTDIIVSNEQVFLAGNNVIFSFDVTSSGMGLTVLVPYSHTFILGPLSAGNYSISLSGNFIGNYIPSSQLSFNVSGVTNECQADFIFSPDTVTPGPLSQDLYQFTDLSYGGNITSWSWDFGDGGTSNLQNPVHGYFNMIPGQYAVCLTILTSGNCTSTFCDTVNINIFPVVCNAEFEFYPGSPGPLSFDIYQFVDQSSGNNIVSWNWDFGDGSISTDQNPSHGFFNMIPAQYIICLTILTSDNCSDTYCDTITIGLIPPYCFAGFSYSLDTLVNCLNCYDFFNESFGSGIVLSWFWNFDDGSYSVEENPIHTFSGPGSYNICLNILTNDGCSSFFCDSLIIPDPNNLGCNAGFNYTINGSPIPEIWIGEFFDNSISDTIIVSWSWDFGDGNASTDQNPTHSYWMGNWGVNNVCLTITTANGCTSTNCELIYVGLDPCMMTMSYSVSPVSFPGGSNGAIDIDPMGGNPPYQYFWNNGLTTQDISGLSEGSYVIWLVDSFGCMANEIIPVEEQLIIPDSQLIVLPSGWSAFSTYIDPFIPDIAEVLNLIEDSVLLVKDGNGIVYWPAYNVNAIGNIQLGEGFQIKMSTGGPYDLVIYGLAAVPEIVPINLPAGWSLIGYLRQTPINITEALTTILAPPYTNGNLIIVKNWQGNIFWPYFGVNNIGTMNPGEAYQLKLTNPAVIYYPAN